MSLLRKKRNQIMFDQNYNINDPVFNYQQICNQICLVNDHLTKSNLDCKYCIHKHLSTIAGLIDEAFLLDSEKIYTTYNKYLQNLLSNLPLDYVRKKYNPHQIAQSLRTARKYIQQNIIFA